MDNDKKRMIILLGILAVVIVYYLWSIGLFSWDKTETLAPPIIQPSTVPHAALPIGAKSNNIEDYSQPVKEFRFDGAWVRDPFYYFDTDSLRAARGAYGLANMRLTGISLRKGFDYSLINTMMFNETDTLMTTNILKEPAQIMDFTN